MLLVLVLLGLLVLGLVFSFKYFSLIFLMWCFEMPLFLPKLPLFDFFFFLGLETVTTLLVYDPESLKVSAVSVSEATLEVSESSGW